MRHTRLFFLSLVLFIFTSCAKSELDIAVGKVEVINVTDKPHAVFVRAIADSLATERYVGTMPKASYILFPLRADEEYEIKIGEVNTGRADKFESKIKLQKDEHIKLLFEGID